MPKDYNLTTELHPSKNAFDLSHNHFCTLKMGGLYPVCWHECLPGDIFTLDFQALVRVQPMIAPIMNNLTVDLHAFFVPTRLLWNKWEDFITTIEQDSIPPKNFEGTPPVWTETENGNIVDIDTSAHSLWDMFGFSRIFNQKAPKEKRPVDFLRRAYILIYNHWFRDENLQEPIDFRTNQMQHVLPRAWRKDYLTAGFVSRQKGTASSIPLTGTGSAVWSAPFTEALDSSNVYLELYKGVAGNVNSSNTVYMQVDNVNGLKQQHLYSANRDSNQITANVHHGAANRQSFLDYLNSNSFDLSQVGTFTVNDLRDMFQIQKFLELLMRAGSRYIEFLQSQWGVSPSDARLQIPERIGGSSFNIQISEVVSTAETELSNNRTNIQGNQTGHGLSVASGHCGNYKCEEFGYIMILANIQPPAVYVDRMPRSMFRKSLLEQVNPHFVNLGYQSVLKREVYADGSDEDEDIFNYQGRYDECREELSYISGDFYDLLDYYLNFRRFDNRPAYNSDFIEVKEDNHIFQVQDEPPFLCNFYFNHKVLRPLPLFNQPGLIDHVYGGL